MERNQEFLKYLVYLCLSCVFLAYNNTCADINQPTFTGWIKPTLNELQEVYNRMPTVISGIGIALAIIIAYFVDFIGVKRTIISHLLIFFNNRVLTTLRMVCSTGTSLGYFLIEVPMAWGQPQILSWVNRLLFEDDMKRNFVVICTNTLAYAKNAFVHIFVWDTNVSPRYFIGFTYTAYA